MQSNPNPKRSNLDPVAHRSLSFVCRRCQAFVDDNKDLVVCVTAPGVTVRGASCLSQGTGIEWTAPSPVSGEVLVEFQSGPRQRFDRSEYLSTERYPSATTFRFRGGVVYGRVPFGDGWALSVQGVVRSIGGLPAAATKSWDAVVVETTSPAPETRPQGMMTSMATSSGGAPGGADVPINGPHLPYP